MVESSQQEKENHPILSFFAIIVILSWYNIGCLRRPDDRPDLIGEESPDRRRQGTRGNA